MKQQTSMKQQTYDIEINSGLRSPGRNGRNSPAQTATLWEVAAIDEANLLQQTKDAPRGLEVAF
jgi:hypothetical protein